MIAVPGDKQPPNTEKCFNKTIRICKLSFEKGKALLYNFSKLGNIQRPEMSRPFQKS